MEDNLIEVYSADEMYRIKMIQELLSENEIESFILNQRGSSFPVGEVKLYVDKKDEAKAKNILSQRKID